MPLPPEFWEDPPQPSAFVQAGVLHLENFNPDDIRKLRENLRELAAERGDFVVLPGVDIQWEPMGR